MNMLKENSLPFSVSYIELGFSIFIGGATWLGLSKFLHSTRPYPCVDLGSGALIDCGWTKQQAWETLGKPLFQIMLFHWFCSLQYLAFSCSAVSVTMFVTFP